LDVAGEAIVVGILLENRLRPSDFRPENLISIDTSVLAAALPASIEQDRAGAPAITAIAAFYGPRSDYNLRARFTAPETELRVTTNILLTLGDQRLDAHGGFALLNVGDKLLEFDFSSPAGWQVTEVTPDGGSPLPLEIYPAADGASRVHVRLPQGTPAGQSRSVYFRAVSSPAGWLDDWRTKSVDFPTFQVAGATRDVGAVAVRAHDDLIARADQVQRLTPLDANEKGKYGLEDVSTQLAFRYEAPPYSLVLEVSRVEPRLTAWVFSFFRAEPELLTAHYEIAYDVTEARANRLVFELPEGTPAELSIRGLDGVSIKESSSTLGEGLRRWTVLLGESRRGSIRLAVDFQQPLPSAEAGKNAPTELTLPLVRAAGVAYQSGMVAVEGSADRDVEVKTALRKVDVGELAEADYQPGRRLLGAFGYGGDQAEIQVVVARPAEYDLPTAIVERAELLTVVSASGRSQTVARFHLRAKALMVEVQLPKDSKLWSAFLDTQPTLPQREADSLLVALPATPDARLRDLQLVYETPIDALGGVGNLDLTAPKLLLRGAAGADSTAVPLADLVWRLSTPAGLKVVRSSGTVFSDDLAVRQSPLSAVASAVSAPFGSVKAARESARRAARQHGVVDSLAQVELKDESGALAESKSVKSEMGEATIEHFALPAVDESADAELAAEADPFAANAPAMPAEEDMGKLAGAKPASPKTNYPASAEAMPSPAKASVQFEGGPGDAEQGFLEGRDGAGGGMGGMGLPPKPATPKQSLWALEGVRSLPIDLQADLVQTTFQSLGSEPRLAVTLVDRTRLDLLGWCIALVVFLRGLWLSRRSRFERRRFVGLTLLIAFVLPLVLPYSGLVGPLCNMAFFAACWLVVCYLFVGSAKKVASAVRQARKQVGMAPAAATALGVLLFAPLLARSDEHVVPVTVPADAIIVPYDPAEHDPLKALNGGADDGKQKPDTPFDTDKAQTILVPYGKYLELLRTIDDKGKFRPAPPAEYVLSGGQFTATLDGGQSLLVEGHLDVEVLVDHAVSVPLALVGGVLTKATLAPAPGNAADQRLDGGGIGAGAGGAQKPVGPQAGNPQPGEPPLAIVVAGSGRRRLDLAVRFRIQRRGGWQIVEGKLPVPVAAALNLRVAKAKTEVILSGGVDRGTIETRRDDETIETALAADGALHVQWRPKAGIAPVDQSLSASGSALFDVQEGGLRLVWHLDLAFRGGQRDSFTLDVPAGYVVEKVLGSNVRGWRLDNADNKEKLEITLLKAAQGSESFSVALSMRGTVGSGDLAQFNVPVLSVQAAAQQSGTLTIRRSPLLQLRTESTSGVSRADAGGPAGANVDAEESPLGILPYQFYRFATTPFTIKLSARAAVPRVSAELQSVLKISARQRTLESRIRMLVAERPIYRLQISIPEDLRLDRVSAPEPFQWVVGRAGERRMLNLYFAGGQGKPFDVVVSGALGDYGPIESLPAPKLEVVAADEQTGQIEQTGHVVVEADPALNVRAEKLVGCESELLSSVSSWLAPAQQQLARLALRYRTPEYSAQFQLSQRKPMVHCTTVSNVRVTQRTVEETLLLDFTIEEAGIRSLSFLLPASMADARISAPMLRQKTITPVADKTGRVRVQLELQEEVMNSLRVLVEDDRLLTGEKYLAPIPEIETGETDQRYITLESAGRDEIVVDQREAVDPVGSEQAEWRMLSAMLGRGLTQAYSVKFAAAQPKLVLRAQDRKTVETATARIGLSKAILAIDAQGAYRGTQLYRVDNSLEQYLVVRLPEGAELWTAHVAGEPVKPAADSASDTVRIPLVKTAPGDADFPVVLKYGGQLGRLAALDSVKFPLMRTVNIHVELSQVELYAPQNYDWFDFGGTMRMAQDEGDLAAGLLEYNTRQIGLAIRSLRSDDTFASTRAANNLKALQADAVRLKQSALGYSNNPELSKQLLSNSSIQEGLQAEISTPAEQDGKQGEADNRSRLGDFYRSQAGSRANDVVSQTGENFQPQVVPPAGQPGEPAQGQTLDRSWFAKNKLENPQAQEPGASPAAKDQGRPAYAGSVYAGSSAGLTPAQPAAPNAFLKQADQADELDRKSAKHRESSAKKAPNQAQRYAERLEQQQKETPNRDQTINFGLDVGRDGSSLANEQLSAPQAPGSGGAPMGGGMPMGKRGGEGGFVYQPGQQPAQQAAQSLAPAALASLDVELRPQGKKYLFTTPRGDVEVTARAVSATLLGRLVRLAILVVLLAVLFAVTRRVRLHWVASAKAINHTH
jgi:hypothetical protein